MFLESFSYKKNRTHLSSRTLTMKGWNRHFSTDENASKGSTIKLERPNHSKRTIPTQYRHRSKAETSVRTITMRAKTSASWNQLSRRSGSQGTRGRTKNSGNRWNRNPSNPPKTPLPNRNTNWWECFSTTWSNSTSSNTSANRWTSNCTSWKRRKPSTHMTFTWRHSMRAMAGGISFMITKNTWKASRRRTSTTSVSEMVW